MHDMRIAFDLHFFGQAHLADLCDATNVIAT